MLIVVRCESAIYLTLYYGDSIYWRSCSFRVTKFILDGIRAFPTLIAHCKKRDPFRWFGIDKSRRARISL